MTEIDETLAWCHRLKRGYDLHLQDLCLSAVQKHVGMLVKYVRAEKHTAIYRGMCPGCGRGIELEIE